MRLHWSQCFTRAMRHAYRRHALRRTLFVLRDTRQQAARRQDRRPLFPSPPIRSPRRNPFHGHLESPTCDRQALDNHLREGGGRNRAACCMTDAPRRTSRARVLQATSSMLRHGGRTSILRRTVCMHADAWRQRRKTTPNAHACPRPDRRSAHSHWQQSSPRSQ